MENVIGGPAFRSSDGDYLLQMADLIAHALLKFKEEPVPRVESMGIHEAAGWAVTYRSRVAVCAPDGTEVHCWPLASPGNRRRVVLDERLEARFETTLESISGFLAFELRQRAGEEDAQTGFVVPVPLAGVPEFRERHLLRTLVGNAERFLRYLLALLDEDADQMNLLDVFEDGGNDPIAIESGSPQLPVLEKLLRTMRCDPSKLAGLHPLVSDLAADDALPPGFAELWTTIYDEARQGASAR